MESPQKKDMQLHRVEATVHQYRTGADWLLSDAERKSRYELADRLLRMFAARSTGDLMRADLNERHTHTFAVPLAFGAQVAFESHFFSRRHFGKRIGEGKEPDFAFVITDGEGKRVMEIGIVHKDQYVRASQLYRNLFAQACEKERARPLSREDPEAKAKELLDTSGIN